MVKVLERDDQLERLDAALVSATCGRGRVVFVGGEAGIGKTALVEHFADRIDTDVRVAFGRCDALGTPRALGPFVDAAQALDVATAADRDTLLGDLVAGIRSSGPVLLVVEDAHWADDATIDIIAMLGRRAVDLPLVFVVTYREDEVGGGHPLRQALGNLATTSGAAWIGLPPLSIDAVRQLAEPLGASADEVYALTGGNPFYVTEALAAPPGSLSTSVRLAVLARASRLSATARDVLDAVAIVPGRAEAWLLDGLVGPAVEDVDECLAAGVLIVDHGDLVFRHELARRAIEHEIPVGRASELHRRAVVTLTDRPTIDPARLAHHAQRGGDDATLARASAAACRLAAARSAYREAIDHGERGLAVADQLSDNEVAELKLNLSAALHAIARSDEAIALAEEVAAHWRSLSDERREAAALIALCSMYRMRGRTSESTAAAMRAVELLEQLPPPGPELAAAYGMLTSVHMLARNRDEAVVWGERAVSLATELDERQILGRSLIEYGIADVMDNRFEGLERVYRGIEIGRANHLPAVVTLGMSQVGSGCGELRRYDHAVPALVEGAAYAAEHDLETARQYIVSWLARCRFDLGQWDEAELHAFDVLGASRRGGIARFVALNTLGWLRARRGDDGVWPLLEEALEIARQTGHLQRLWPCAVARAEAAWLEGSLDDHVDLLAEMLFVAESCRHQMAVGELSLWLGRAGRDPVTVVEGAEPFASWNRGDALGAAAGFLSIGCPYEAASAQSASGDTASLRLALATFERLGAVPAAQRVATELRARGVRVARTTAPASRPAGPGGLSEREIEVLRLVTAGFTNPQIAGSLYISRKTAEHHVSNILTKLGVTSRAEAAAASVRLGISEM